MPARILSSEEQQEYCFNAPLAVSLLTLNHLGSDVLAVRNKPIDLIGWACKQLILLVGCFFFKWEDGVKYHRATWMWKDWKRQGDFGQRLWQYCEFKICQEPWKPQTPSFPSLLSFSLLWTLWQNRNALRILSERALCQAPGYRCSPGETFSENLLLKPHFWWIVAFTYPFKGMKSNIV